MYDTTGITHYKKHHKTKEKVSVSKEQNHHFTHIIYMPKIEVEYITFETRTITDGDV